MTTGSMLLAATTAFTSPPLHAIRPSSAQHGLVTCASIDLLQDQPLSLNRRISQRKKFTSSGFSDHNLYGTRRPTESDLSYTLTQDSDIIDDEISMPSSMDVDLKPNETLSPQDDENGGITLMPTQSIFLLNLVAIIWGTQHSAIKMVVEDCDASAFSLARFGLAAIIASPFTPALGPFINKVSAGWENIPVDNISDMLSQEESEESILAWRWGLEMGLWMFLGYAFQAIGLEYTTAQRSGFLLYLNVKFVPFFARILLGRQISIPTWISALIAFTGTALISFGDVGSVLNIGDLWSIAAAAASAMFILRLETATRAVKTSSALNSASLWVVTMMALVWCIGEGIHRELMIPSELPSYAILSSAIESTTSNLSQTISSHPFNLIYLGGVTTALANYIQTVAQRGVTAERASIIYALDPVYGAIFANLLLGEQLSSIGLVGAGLITFAAAANAYIDLTPRDSGGDSSSSGVNISADRKEIS